MLKKITPLLILLTILALALAACSSSENAAQDTSVEADPSTVQTETTEADSAAETGEEVSTDYPYTIVDTDQTWCFSDSEAVECGEVFVGQDAQYEGLQPAYQDNGDGTITDLNTGLMWIQDAGNKTTYADAIEELQTYTFAGYDDWRLPTIKELYSLALFSGVDASMASSSDVDGLWPLIDDDYFAFLYGDESGGQRVIDAQWLSSNVYVSTVMGDQSCFFGFNFSDGRIKCYGLDGLGPSGGYFAQYVRGGDDYGVNDFVENGDDTITDNATGLTWTQNDNGEALDWDSALNYCESLSLGGSDEWRLPNIKDLHSLVDYSRSPDTTDSAAIDPLFNMTQITNEAGEPDYGFYWSSTTLISYPSDVSWATYISFGRALGYMEEFGGWVDVHGAGAQRSDPKVPGEEFEFGNGPQGDAVRQYNYVLCVSDGVVEPSDGDDPSTLVLANPENFVPADISISAGNAPAGAGNGQTPDLASAAATLGITEQELMAALGPPPPDFAAAAETLGISVEELQDALGNGGEGSPPEGGPPPAEGGQPPADGSEEEAMNASTTFQLDAWADNWFAAYLGEELIVEDSVSITTERSFNAETATFEASYPLNLNFILKDFKENDTGLEYIGSNRQQMGDGGFIMQLTDTNTGDVVAVSNADWACTVIHEAPLDKACETESNPVAGTAPCEFNDLGEPEGWKAADFDDSSWTATTVHSANEVSPKDGYDRISWAAGAQLIWGPDLETNNTILCRVTVEAP